MTRTLLAGAWLSLCVAVAAGAQEYARELVFARDGETVRVVPLDALRGDCEGVRVEVDDPYYQRTKRFYACPLGPLLEAAFAADAASLAQETFFLRARDGYTRTESGTRLLEAGGYLAFADADLSADGSAAFDSSKPFSPRFEPIDRRQVDPGPFYLVWTGDRQEDPHQYPWPYQLATIEVGSFERAFPHMVPAGAPDGSPARAGFELFQRECMACHAINGEGGTVGPDLNIPQSIVEYRPKDQIAAFIRNPRRFRYTSMPAHEHLGDAQLQSLIAYFEWMRDHKFDPHGAPAS